MYFLKLVEGISFLPMVYPEPAVRLLWLQKGWATPCACPQYARQSWNLLASSERAAADSPRRLKLEPAVASLWPPQAPGLGVSLHHPPFWLAPEPQHPAAHPHIPP